MSGSTRLFVALAGAALCAAPVHATGFGTCADPHVGAAVRASVEARLGRRAEVTLDGFTCALAANAPQTLAASPDPVGRTGRAIRFAILSNTRGRAVRLGEATAIVHVAAEHVRVRTAMPQGSVLAAGDLEVATGPIENIALRKIPSMAELLGARLTRGLTSGQAILADAVVVPPAVKAGEPVQVTVRQGGVEATVMAVAEQNAAIGQVIRVVNASSRKPLRARVTAPGEVEVVNER